MADQQASISNNKPKASCSSNVDDNYNGHRIDLGMGKKDIMWSCGWGGCGEAVEEDESIKAQARAIEDPAERVAFLRGLKEKEKARELAEKDAKLKEAYAQVALEKKQWNEQMAKKRQEEAEEEEAAVTTTTDA